MNEGVQDPLVTAVLRTKNKEENSALDMLLLRTRMHVRACVYGIFSECGHMHSGFLLLLYVPVYECVCLMKAGGFGNFALVAVL